MSVSTISLPEGACVEVCRGDRLIGYAIKFSGGWDGWCKDTHKHVRLTGMTMVACNVSKTKAIEAIKSRWEVTL